MAEEIPPSRITPQKQFYAHSTEGSSENWEPLFTPFGEVDDTDPRIGCTGNSKTPCPHCENLSAQHGHLNKVAYLAGEFAKEMFPEGPDRETTRQWGYLAGLWHDLGKYSQEFQNYLADSSGGSDSHVSEVREKVDHTSAGAQMAARQPLGYLIATAIAGHHAGLLDARSEHACLEKRLKKDLPSVLHAPKEVTAFPLPAPPAFLNSGGAVGAAFFQRMIFSCLVDADFLATEAFMNSEQSALRPQADHEIFLKAQALLDQKIFSFGEPETTVALARAEVYHDCLDAAEREPGLFTLTVPTGGGKTLSSLAFALTHAIKYQKKRVIYVIPFTSIIEQNAAVFRDVLEVLGDDIVIEHHSNLSPEKETTRSRLATENWDAPIIVTTAVQFYESLYAAKTSRSRKLHNIANSVVILDEAQAIPVDYLSPCLRALDELTRSYNTTAVLCTATQPTVRKTDRFPIGLEGVREIVRDTASLFRNLKRVEVTYRGSLDDQTLSHEIADCHQVLCIVNTRAHAQALYQSLPETDENYHLSALMCPEHRLQILEMVRNRLTDGLPTRLISTQLIEAGVDVDFPVVYRSMAGLDSIAQAAGRCNRNGTLGSPGIVHVFHSEHLSSERYFRETANIGHEILDVYPDDPLGTRSIDAYFDNYYYQKKGQDFWDKKKILANFQLGGPDLPLLFQYKKAADDFRLIEQQQVPVIIPFDKKAKKLCADLRRTSIPLKRKLLRSLQRYTVQIYEPQFRNNYHQFKPVRDGDFHILVCPESHYSDDYGLDLSKNPQSVFLCPG